ncbi:MAG: hypothetical protein HFG05_05435 [Oscillibacter sp.]|nr:hypothetical protein [Oscillibacter sp.]
MANRPHGRGRVPSGERTSQAGRPARAVPVSRSPARGGESPRPGTPIYTEPEVRRWPHPLEDPAPPPEPAMHYIRCALSYQNQLLADIKALLERLSTAAPAAESPPEPEKGGETLTKL